MEKLNEFEIKKQKMLKKKRRNRAKRRFVVLLFVLICVGIIVTVLKAPLFNVKTITCEGQKELTKEQIISISGAKVNTNIFSVGVSAMEKRLTGNPQIAECEVRRIFPNTIRIHITEAVSLSYIEVEKEFLLIAKSGEIIKTLPKPGEYDFSKMTKILDLKPLSTKPGDNIVAENDIRGQAILECIGILEKKDLIGKITTVSMADLSDVKMEYENRLNILLGDYEKLEYKLTFIKGVIDKGISNTEESVLDCRGDNLYVGPKEEPPMELPEDDSEEENTKESNDNTMDDETDENGENKESTDETASE